MAGVIGVVFLVIVIAASTNSKKKAASGATGTAATTVEGSASTRPLATASTTAPAGPKTTFGAGEYRVGVDIAPGTYVSAGGNGCYWERERTFGGSGLNDIIANDLTNGGQVVVTIAASDDGFKTSGCATWHPAS